MAWNEGQNRLRGSLDREQGKKGQHNVADTVRTVSAREMSFQCVRLTSQAIIIVIFNWVFEIE